MVTTVSEAFETLSSNLEITDLQTETVSTRQTTVRAAVEAGFDVLDSFLAGSYKRSTMIAPLKEADVDIFVVLDPKYFGKDGQVHILDQTKDVLRRRYKTPDISRNGQAVTIVFDDFRVDVVPCFHRKGGGYLIPDSHRSVWIPTDPKKHVQLWSKANQYHDGAFVPLVKMLKGWNQSRELLRSFHLETLALTVFTDVNIDTYPSAVRFFFDKARAWIPVKLPDPAGYSEDVGSYMTSQDAIAKVVERLAWAHDRALEAEDLDARGKTKDAIDKWWVIFKEYFPAHG